MHKGEFAAKTVSTLGIWAAVTLILVFGVFRMNFNGDLAIFLLFLIVVVICGAAGGSTAAVWGQFVRPGLSQEGSQAGDKPAPPRNVGASSEHIRPA